MLNKEVLDKMLEDKKILYIYYLPAELYDIQDNWDYYIVIIKDNYNPKYINYPDIHIFRISDWFQMVLDCEIRAWKCACLPKKYILKEYVKLLMSTNPIKLRTDFDTSLIQTENLNLKNSWELLLNLKLINQIIDNHKIINFKITKDDYSKLANSTNIETTFWELINKPYEELKKKTDELIRKQKIDNYLNGKV